MRKKNFIKPLNILSKKEMKSVFGGEEEACSECWAGPYSCGDPCSRPVSTPPDCSEKHCYGSLLCSDHLSYNY